MYITSARQFFEGLFDKTHSRGNVFYWDAAGDGAFRKLKSLKKEGDNYDASSDSSEDHTMLVPADNIFIGSDDEMMRTEIAQRKHRAQNLRVANQPFYPTPK